MKFLIFILIPFIIFSKDLKYFDGTTAYDIDSLHQSKDTLFTISTGSKIIDGSPSKIRDTTYSIHSIILKEYPYKNAKINGLVKEFYYKVFPDESIPLSDLIKYKKMSEPKKEAYLNKLSSDYIEKLTGSMYSSCWYVNDIKHGTEHLYNESGNISEMISYKDGVEHGLYLIYSSSTSYGGRILAYAIYDNGYEKTLGYYSDGSVKKIIVYNVDGRPLSTKRSALIILQCNR